jgi:hypothetical protein
MDRNETIQIVNRIAMGNGLMGGYGLIEIDGNQYYTVSQFKSSRSTCYKQVIDYLQYNNVPHFVKKVVRSSDGVLKRSHIDVIIL